MKIALVEAQNYYPTGHWLEAAYLFAKELIDMGHVVTLLTTNEEWVSASFEELAKTYGAEVDVKPVLKSAVGYKRFRTGVGLRCKSSSLSDAIRSPVSLAWALLTEGYSRTSSCVKNLANDFSSLVKFGKFDAVILPTADNLARTLSIDFAARLLGIKMRRYRFVGSELEGLIAAKNLRFTTINPSAIAFESMGNFGWDVRNPVVLFPDIPSQEVEAQDKVYDWALLGKPRKSKFDIPVQTIWELDRLGLRGQVQISDDLRQEFPPSGKNIDYLPSWLATTELHRAISRAKALILPYSPEVYSLTSSAFVPIAATYKTFIIAPEGTEIGAQVKHLGTGVTFSDAFDLPDKVRELQNMDFSPNWAATRAGRRSSLETWLFGRN